MTPLLEAEGLSLPGRLHPTALRIDSGQFVCLVGPNGSGKTSLLHAVAGIGSAAGNVRIDGADPRTLGAEARKALLSYLPASRDIRWPVSAADLIALGLPARADRSGVGALLEELGLDGFADRPVDRLSTGERSRVLIGRALAARPRLLLLDEPVANLDPLWQLLLMDRLRAEVSAGGRAALVAIHDLDLAGRYADRLIVVDGGRIVADGGADVLGRPVIPKIFGIERVEGEWRPVRRPEDPRSSP